MKAVSNVKDGQRAVGPPDISIQFEKLYLTRNKVGISVAIPSKQAQNAWISCNQALSSSIQGVAPICTRSFRTYASVKECFQ